MAFVSVTFAIALATTSASADSLSGPKPPPPGPARSLWRPEWPSFSRWEGAATLAAGVGTGVLFVLKPPSDPRWEGGILFDDAVRDGMRLESESARQRMRGWGDLPYYASPLLPLIIDPLVAAWLIRDDKKAALNLEAVGLEAFAYAGLLSFVSTRVSVRARPDSTQCRRDHADPNECSSDTESFYSGHTTIGAASAGVVCATHRVMPLWGHPLADAAACALATGGALFTGVSRLASDRHYATDVIAGFGMGFGIGYAVPTILHFSRVPRDLNVSVAPGGPCTGACLKVSGTF